MDTLGVEKTFGIFDNSRSMELIHRIEAAGNKAVRLPCVTRETLEPDSKAEEVVNNLATFDWIVFADAWSVDSFFEIARNFAVELSELDDINVCSVGETTASRLRSHLVHSDVTNQTPDADAVLKNLAYYCGGLSGQRILSVFGDDKSFALLNNPAEINRLQVYRTRFSPNANTAKVRAMLVGGAVDAVVISSIDDMSSLKALVHPEPLAQLSGDIEIYAADAESRQMVLEQGFRPRNLCFDKTKL